MQKKTILVVGGAGFIGSHVNKMLHQAGYHTIVLDNLTRGHRENVREGKFIQGNLGDRKILDLIFQQHPVDAVMHFAAHIDVGESVRDPAKYYLNNVANTLTLLQAMRDYGINAFVFSSSAAIFGNPVHNPITEDLPCHPINPYGETKWMMEKILKDFYLAYGLNSCCLRYFNAAGGDPKGELKNYQTHITNLIPLVLRSLKSPQGQVTIFGTDYPTPDGTCIRDYVHIEDLGSAHILGMEHLFKDSAFLYYNLGNGQGYSVREVIHSAEQVTGKKVNAKEGPRRPGDPPILVADSTKAMQELGWKPRYATLETMIEHAWKALTL